MRITGGTHRSRLLEAPNGEDIRPTSDKVRLALFNMLNARNAVFGGVVLDGFCGTGALGLEAISQGAVHCCFMDTSKVSLDLCRRNISSLGLSAQTKIMHQDITQLKNRQNEDNQFSLVFLDPPYRQGLVIKAVRSLVDGDWVSPHVVFVIEMAKNEKMDNDSLSFIQEKIYGDTKVILAVLK